MSQQADEESPNSSFWLEQSAETKKSAPLIPPLPTTFAALPHSMPIIASINAASASPSAQRQCRICLLSSETRRRPLISPCRCAGSVQHVHLHCLAHWIEVSVRKLSPHPQCELCGYRYRRKRLVDPTRLHFPFMEMSDRVLNSLCGMLVAIMVLCGWVAVHHLSMVERRMASGIGANPREWMSAAFVAWFRKRPSLGRSPPTSSSALVPLAEPDVTVLIAVVLFFAAFFLALFTQYRAEVTLFRAISRFWATNRNWRIREYSPDRDALQQRHKRQLKLLAQEGVPEKPERPTTTVTIVGSNSGGTGGRKR